MSGKFNPEDLVHHVSEVKGSIEAIVVLFRNLMQIVDEEHEAVRHGLISRLKEITTSKEGFAHEIGERLAAIQKHGQAIGVFHQNLNKGGDLSEKNPANIEQIMAWLRDLVAAVEGPGLGAGVLRHLVDGLQEQLLQYRELKQAAMPKIEVNVILTRKLLDHHRRMDQLFRQVERESNETYGAKGTVRPQKSASIFRKRT